MRNPVRELLQVGITPFSVPCCDYRSSNDHYRKQQEATHDPFRAKIYQCTYYYLLSWIHCCLKSESTIRCHMNERTDQCEQCKYAAFTALKLNLHVQNRHRSFECVQPRYHKTTQGRGNELREGKEKLLK